MIELKTPGEIDAVAAAGRVVATILATLRDKAAPGVSPHDLDLIARDMISDAGAVSSFVGYHPSWSPTPYPAVICSSVNDAVVHGIPDQTPLQPGDPWSLQHPFIYTMIWVVAIVLVCAPLSVRLYQRSLSR